MHIFGILFKLLKRTFGGNLACGQADIGGNRKLLNKDIITGPV